MVLHLYADNPIAITLEGGYNCDYSVVTGVTTFSNTMTVDDGVVTIGDFIFE